MSDYNLTEDDVSTAFRILLSALIVTSSHCHKKTIICFIKVIRSAGQQPVHQSEHRGGCWQEWATENLYPRAHSKTSMVPWVRVMASLHWAALRYCRITEQLIETNDSNNGTLSPQAGFVVGLISVAVAARNTSHHADTSEEGRRSLLFKQAVGDFYTSSV